MAGRSMPAPSSRGLHRPRGLFSSQGQHNHCLRLNSSHPWSPQLDAALNQLAGLIARQRETWQSPLTPHDKGP